MQKDLHMDQYLGGNLCKYQVLLIANNKRNMKCIGSSNMCPRWFIFIVYSCLFLRGNLIHVKIGKYLHN